MINWLKWYKQRRLVDNKMHKIEHEGEGVGNVIKWWTDKIGIKMVVIEWSSFPELHTLPIWGE